VSNLKNRVGRLERETTEKPIRYMWIKPDWSRREIEARETEFRQENGFSGAVEVVLVGWLPIQEKEGEQQWRTSPMTN